MRLKNVVVVAALASMSVTGCSKDRPADPGNSAASDAPSSSSPTAVVGPDAQAKAIGLDPKNLPKPIATEKLTTGLKRGQSTDIKLYRLEKRGQVMLAYLSVTPHNFDNSVSVYDALGGRAGSMRFLDLTNLKAYSQVDDAGPDTMEIKGASEQTLFYWKAFPQLLPQAKRINVQFTDTSPRMHEVPLP